MTLYEIGEPRVRPPVRGVREVRGSKSYGRDARAAQKDLRYAEAPSPPDGGEEKTPYPSGVNSTGMDRIA